MKEIKVEKLNVNNIDKYIKSLSIVLNNMSNPEWLGDFTREDYQYLLENNIMDIYVWSIDDIYVGAASLIKVDEVNIEEYKLSMFNSNEVIDFGPIWVNPNHTGNGYQVKFIKYLEEVADKSYKCFVTTIDPNNIISIHNFEKCNFKSMGEVNLKRGKRLVLTKIREE